MKEETEAAIALLGIGVPVACCFHFFIIKKKVANLLSVSISVVLFQVLAYFDLGYLDPFFIIAMAFSALIFFGISSVVGELIERKRNRKGGAQNEQ